MNSGLHLAAGWLVAEAFGLDYKNRRVVAISGVAPDLDGLAIFGGFEAFRRYHHFVFHNLLAAAVFVAIVALLCRRLRTTIAASLALLLHLACDLLASHWSLYPLEPFCNLRLNMTDFLPYWVVVYLIQGAGTVLILALVFAVAWRRERTFLEVFIKRGDLLVVRWFREWLSGRRCGCGRRAHFVCRHCGERLCARHIRLARKPLRVLCEQCAKTVSARFGAKGNSPG